MYSHTLILSTSKIAIPEGVSINLITTLINQGLTAIDYFGVELDNQADVEEEDMKAVSASISYFEFFFETEKEIDYDSLSVLEINDLILDKIKKSDIKDLRSDGKDITIYL